MFKMVFILTILLSFLNAFEVSKNMSFNKKLTPDTLFASFKIYAEDKSRLNIQKMFQKAIKTSKNEEICTNGSYTISPKYKDDIFKGYTGRIGFDCKFKEIKKFDNIISKIDNINKDKLKTTLYPLRWILDDNVSNNEIKKLELEALRYASSYAIYLSSVYSKECSVKRVDLHNALRPSPIFRSESMALKSSVSSEPINSDITLSYSASYLFNCD